MRNGKPSCIRVVTAVSGLWQIHGLATTETDRNTDDSQCFRGRRSGTTQNLSEYSDHSDNSGLVSVVADRASLSCPGTVSATRPNTSKAVVGCPMIDRKATQQQPHVT